ncbi:energy transducer TonB [Xenorhabdus lircayensis]|uniref:Energy transducer TonB n=1 Tax=Xenorhabdus lircayensis TaxID=2763499 RepID=A0ABS0U3P1_9GAMM|nr:energy transducer TonB [Xenorhabdus lircayensis]MBI6548094.1 energy transducer TonB [Xenorhabdus lircayensis]
MTNTAILDNPVAHSPLTSPKGLLVGILIAILLHISLIWLFNRHASYDDDTAHHINNNAPATGLSITMVAASSWESEPEPVSPPPPLLTAPESPTTPEIVLDKTVHPENRVEKPLESNNPKKRKKQQKEKPQEMAEKKPAPSSQVQKDSHTEQETNGSNQINSQGSMSRAATSQPLVGQGNSEVDNYRARLRQEIERHKDYPRKAKRMKQQGTVTVNFTLLSDGTLTTAKVVNSSGNSTLDNAALNAINRTSSVGPIPADIPSDVTLQLDFKLD